MKRWGVALFLAALAVTSTTVVISMENDAPAAEMDGQPSGPKLRSGGENFAFKAEVTRLMDIIINSLYSNKDIFLRELISNASDALDKIRLLALSDAKQLGEGKAANLEIRMEIDKEKNVLKLRDRGVGMTKDELVRNLGTIAKSGTSSFLEKMQQGGDVNLIGQFGVGFYSVYLVADYVEVISKSNDDVQHIWESTAGGEFVISKDEGGEVSGEGDLERGSMIRIHLKEENLEYAQEGRLKELVKKYSDFINFPIYLLGSKEVEVDDDEPEAADSSDGIEDEEDEADSTPEDKPKKMVTVQEWQLLNSNKALWLRNAKDIEPEEYKSFYTALSKDADDSAPMAHAHFKAEGDVDFRSILYVPAKAAYDFYDNYYSRAASIKLYVRRVFISDEFADLLPRYLSFLLGVVDSDTLPLNVSREMLQQHSSLKTIKKKLVRKALDMIKKLAKAEQKARKRLAAEASGEKVDNAEEEDGEEVEEFNREALEKDVSKYEELWAEFGKALKLGIMEDANNRVRLAQLIRFHSSASPDTLTSLDAYISRMKEGQKEIYFICGGSMEEVQRSPFLEKLLEKGFEVILFTEPMDEYMMQNMLDYEDRQFQNASKEDLKLDGDDEDAGKLEKQQKKAFKPLTQWWRKLLGQDGGLEAVRVSSRLSNTPCVIVTSKYGWSANMQRIMQAQALGDAQRQAYMMGKKTMEINPRHPLIVALLDKVTADPEDAAAAETARLLFETALLESGYPMQDHQAFASRVYGLMKEQIGLERELSDLHPEPELVDTEEEEEAQTGPTDDLNWSIPEGLNDEL